MISRRNLRFLPFLIFIGILLVLFRQPLWSTSKGSAYKFVPPVQLSFNASRTRSSDGKNTAYVTILRPQFGWTRLLTLIEVNYG